MWNHEYEARRRDIIRSTVLSFYRNSTTSTKTTANRICSLSYFIKNYYEITAERQEDDNDNGDDDYECQLVYAFVVGAFNDTTAPSTVSEDLVEAYWNSDGQSVPMVVDPIINTKSKANHTPHSDGNSKAVGVDDLVYLNIKENMNKGKSQSWFLYASRGIRVPSRNANDGGNHDDDGDDDTIVIFDYIAKMDTDTVLYPNRLLDRTLKKHTLPSFPNNGGIYGGNLVIKKHDDDRAIRELAGPYYMQGAFYYLSFDLARYISSPDCPRRQWDLFSEDKSIGNFVHTYPRPIRHRAMLDNNNYYYNNDGGGGGGGGTYMVHPYKEIWQYRKAWKKYVDKMQNRRRWRRRRQ